MSWNKYFESGSEDQSLYNLSRLLTNPNIRVLWKHAETLMFKQKDKGIYGKTIFYVFHHDIKEELQHEQKSFKSKLETAKEVGTDERYYKLTNAQQRELYMLSEHFLSETEAQDVIELLKPELAQIIRNGEIVADEIVLYKDPDKPESKPEGKQPKAKAKVKKVKKQDIGSEDIDKELEDFEKELEAAK